MGCSSAAARRDSDLKRSRKPSSCAIAGAITFSATNRPSSTSTAQDEGFRERFRSESRRAAALEHPNVLPVYRSGEDDGSLYIAMRFVDGATMQELIDRRGRLPVGAAVRIVSQVADALDAAHAHGLVHRDVKPGNVMISEADGEGVRDLGDDPHRRSHREAAAPVDQLLQGGAVDEAHGDVEAPVLLAAAVDGEDVGVLQRRRASRLGPEALAEALVLRDRRGDHLERDQPAQLDVDRAVHDSHATGARAPLDPVAGDHAAGRQQAEPGEVGLSESENRPALVHGSVASAVGGDPRLGYSPAARGGNRRRCGPRGAAHGRARCPMAGGGWSCPPTGCSCRAGT